MRFLRMATAVLAALSTAILSVFLFPSLVINKHSLPWAARILRAYDIPVSWEQGAWTARSVSFWKKEFSLQLTRACYSRAAPYTHACLEKVDTLFVFNVATQSLHVKHIAVPGGNLVFEDKTDSPPPTDSDGAARFSALTPLQLVHDIRTRWIGRFHFDTIDIRELSILVAAPASVLRLSADARGTTNAQGSSLTLTAKGRRIAHARKTGLRASLRLNLPTDKPIEYSFAFASRGPRLNSKLQTRGTIETSTMTGRLDAAFSAPWKNLTRLSAKQCAYEWKESPARASLLALDCLVHLSSKQRAVLPVGMRLGITIPRSANEKVRGTLTTHLDDFGKLVHLLEATPFAVPAPLNQLGGNATVNATADTDISLNKVVSEFDLQTRLDSNHQHLHLQAKGKLTSTPLQHRPHAHLDLSVDLEKVRLSLPTLDPVNLPRLVPDPAVGLSPTRNSRDSAFTYRVHFVTHKDKPALLHSQKLGSDIPLEISLVAENQTGIRGYVRIRDFALDLFRRKARIELAEVRFPVKGVPELQGSAQIHYTDYDLTLQASGPLTTPRFQISSQPPLSEQSALALLFFGRPLEELSPGQGESLANARAAITNGAVSALSMYLLASTPIESIGYDTVSGRFLATIRLVEGTSLRVEGMKEGISSLGLRRRLGRNWVLNTYVERASPTDDKRSVSTYLEWSKTY